MAGEQMLIRVQREDIERGKINEVLGAFEKLGATGVMINQQITEANQATRWTVSGELVGVAVPTLSELT